MIGLGHIGAGVARRLALHGFEVWGCDVRPQPLVDLVGVLSGAGSPLAVAQRTGTVLVAVLDDHQVREVLFGPDGVAAGADRPCDVLVLSTTTLATIRSVGADCERAGISLLDCGVSGGRGGFEAGQVTAMVGGESDAFTRVRPVIETFADPVLHMGPLGRGMAAKLARNVLVYTDWSVAWEAARLAQAAGVDLDAFVTAVQASDRYVDGHTALISAGLGLGGETDELRAHGAALSVYANKDLAAAIELSDELAVELPAARLALAQVRSFTGQTPRRPD